MRLKVLGFIALSVAVLALSVPLSAHHGTSAYDLANSITAKATVTGITWSNPHCLLNFDIKDEKGVATYWSIEMYNPLYMTRAGWTKDILKSGDQITITFHAAKNGVGNGYIRQGDGKIVLANGKVLGFDQGAGN